MNHLNINFEIQKAKKLTKNGNVEEAKKIYENIILHYPKNLRVLDALKNLNWEGFKLNYDKAMDLYQQKRFDEAYDLAINLLKNDTKSSTLLNLLGGISLAREDLDSAKFYFNSNILSNPNFVHSYNNLGLVHAGLKEFKKAIEYYLDAIKLDPNFSECYKNLGVAYREIGEPHEAIKYFEKAFETNNKDATSLNSIGLILKFYEKYNEALEYFNKSISIEPSYVYYSNRGNTKAALGDFDGALSDFNIALRYNNKSAEIYNNIASALNEKGMPADALPYLKKAIQLKDDYADAYNNLGIANEFLKNREESIKYFKKALEFDPTNDDASTFLSYWHFTEGEYNLFRKRYRSRLFKKKSREAIPLDIAQPFYEAESFTVYDEDGINIFQPRNESEVLKNKSIVLYDEQGIGDEIFFVGLLKEFMKNVSDKITIVCSDRAKTIYNLSLKDIEVFTRDEIKNVNLKFDYEMPIGSLMEYTDYENNSIFPLDQYLVPSKPLKEFWENELKTHFKGKTIGICWRGGRTSGQLKKRTLSLSDILQKLPLDGNYVNLQYGPVEDDISKAEQVTGRKIINFEGVDPLKEIDNQFAIISNLDHVITVQGTTYHMAGALSIPTTGLLSVAPDFRYLNKGKKSFFYKSVEHLRQQKISDWEPVLNKMKVKFENYFKK